MGAEWTVVGVVEQARMYELQADDRGQLYIPYAVDTKSHMGLAVRTRGDPAALAAALTREVHAIDSDQPVFDVRTMPQVVSASLAARRFSMALMSAFAWLAMVLAAVGLYGVISHSVVRRTREIGIRMALGAPSGQVVRLVLRDGLALAGAGLVLGLVVALAGSRLIAGLVYGVSPRDPLTLAAVAVLLTAMAAAATYIPARRASRLDPMDVLRHE